MPNRSNTRLRLKTRQSRSHPLLLRPLCWRSLYWLLALSLSLQSIAPTALAANATLGSDTGVTASKTGIWTISCAGKPLWLPISHSAVQISDATTIDDKPEHSNDPLHCLICNNLAGFEFLSATSVHPDFATTEKSVSNNSSNISTTASQVQKACRCRAPPVSFRD